MKIHEEITDNPTIALWEYAFDTRYFLNRLSCSICGDIAHRNHERFGQVLMRFTAEKERNEVWYKQTQQAIIAAKKEQIRYRYSFKGKLHRLFQRSLAIFGVTPSPLPIGTAIEQLFVNLLSQAPSIDLQLVTDMLAQCGISQSQESL